MTKQELASIRLNYLNKYHPYKMIKSDKFSYKCLSNIFTIRRPGRGDNDSYNDCIIMADTETSKKPEEYNYKLDEYKDVWEEVHSKVFKYNKNFKEVATIAELRRVGLRMSTNGLSKIDVEYEYLHDSMQWLFPDDAYSDIDALYYIYNYLSNPPADDPHKGENHVCAFTISIRAFDRNLVTLYGNKPSECIEALENIHNNLKGDKTVIYFHNLSYDWVFLRKFFFNKFGFPVRSLNTKPHYPIMVEFANGLVIKDSLILAQRGLEKWAKDLNVEHLKASGKWDYDILRDQQREFSKDELEYIEHDTLAGVECIQKTMDTLQKKIFSMPYTATGIPREELRKRAKPYKARDRFKAQALTYEQQLIMEQLYHGGYTHGNRKYVNRLIIGDIKMYDFASSYPFVMLSEKYPSGKFTDLHDCDISYILRNSENYAFMFKLVMINPRLKDDSVPMPALQYSKCVKVFNPIADNGRILAAHYIEIYLNEIDLEVIADQYTFDKHLCVGVQVAPKDYLPKWFTDYIYECFTAKTMLKGGDAVQYSIAKAKVNSLYGMCVQHPVKDELLENYETGDYDVKEDFEPEDAYEKYLNNRNTILPYQWGVWVTSYAFRNLFKLGACAGTWLYSDTDSCAGMDWDEEALSSYNKLCKEKLQRNGYGPVVKDGREYWLGIAELDEDHIFTEFKFMGAKRYAFRTACDNELHITVAGVPKKNGAKCLNNDINKFAPDFIFKGSITGKQGHVYHFVDNIYIDKNGNETGDSIDLNPCDYLLDSTDVYDDWERMFEEEIAVPIFDESLYITN